MLLQTQEQEKSKQVQDTQELESLRKSLAEQQAECTRLEGEIARLHKQQQEFLEQSRQQSQKLEREAVQPGATPSEEKERLERQVQELKSREDGPSGGAQAEPAAVCRSAEAVRD